MQSWSENLPFRGTRAQYNLFPNKATWGRPSSWLSSAALLVCTAKKSLYQFSPSMSSANNTLDLIKNLYIRDTIFTEYLVVKQADHFTNPWWPLVPGCKYVSSGCSMYCNYSKPHLRLAIRDELRPMPIHFSRCGANRDAAKLRWQLGQTHS